LLRGSVPAKRVHRRLRTPPSTSLTRGW
jgi:hypothetical protein